MTGTSETPTSGGPADLWDALHAVPRYRPRFPQDDVVRFLAPWFDNDVRGMKALDIGLGAGRHTRLLCQMGFSTSGVDISREGIRHAKERLSAEGLDATLVCAPMTELPFADEAFDVVVCYGVLNYATRAAMARAVGEMRRVMRSGARGVVMLRTTDDYRYGKGRELEQDTFELTIQETGEQGTVQHFLAEDDVPLVFAAFSELSYEKREATFDDRRKKNSDWIVRVSR